MFCGLVKHFRYFVFLTLAVSFQDVIPSIIYRLEIRKWPLSTFKSFVSLLQLDYPENLMQFAKPKYYMQRVELSFIDQKCVRMIPEINDLIAISKNISLIIFYLCLSVRLLCFCYVLYSTINNE